MLEQQLTTPSWTEFAWCAFLYKMINEGDEDYLQLIEDDAFLKALRTNPKLQWRGIQEKLIKFLNKWKTRVEKSDESAQAIAKRIEAILPDLRSLGTFSIRDVDLGTVGDSPSPTVHVIENCYDSIRNSKHNVGATATAKILHILHPDLFVMWDNPILLCFEEGTRGKVNDSGAGYREYLRVMQQTANHITQEFKEAELYPPPSSGTTPEHYLFTQLKYRHAKTMAKYLDEYHWVLITHLKTNDEKTNLKIPPEWHPEKRPPAL
jgi:hypothetical protein